MSKFNDELISLFEQMKMIISSSISVQQSKNYNSTKDSTIFKSLGLAFVIVNIKTSSFEMAGGDTAGLLELEAKEILSKNFTEILELLPENQLKLYTEALKWRLETLQKILMKSKDVTHITNQIITFNTLSGKNKRLLLLQEILEEDKEHNPVRVLVFFKDIKHLIKDDNFWCRLSVTNHNDIFTSCYHSKLGIIDGDIISKREKDILLLIDDGLTTKEIADKLFISPITVNNHRANMLTRTGAKDTNALVQIAQMCSIL